LPTSIVKDFPDLNQSSLHLTVVLLLPPLPLLWFNTSSVNFPDDVLSRLPGITTVFIQEQSFLFPRPSREILLPYYLEIFIF
jgi:hypothetical protein